MSHPTFEQLPEMVNLLLKKVESLEIALVGISSSNSDEDFLTVVQAADFLKLSVPTLYSKVSRGEIPVNKPGKRLYFKKSKLIEWINESRKNNLNEFHERVSNYNVPRLRHVRRSKRT